MTDNGERARGGGHDILVVEDNPINQMVVVALLVKWGHRVVVAGDGAQCLEAMEKQGFDLVLMDIQMPVMDGIEATCAIRARERERGGHLPIIAVTAHAALKDRERCLAAGVDRYLTKPLNSELLRQTVAELLPDVSREPIAASPEAGVGTVDFEQLKRCVGDDPELIAEVIQVFLDDTPVTLECVANAIRDQAPAALESSAHRLKGSLATMGAPAAAEIAARLEATGRQGELVGALELYERLCFEIRATSDCLRKWKESPAD